MIWKVEKNTDFTSSVFLFHFHFIYCLLGHIRCPVLCTLEVWLASGNITIALGIKGECEQTHSNYR